jgi:LPS sulfotransferase NodH
MADAPPFLVTIATQRSGTKFLGTAFSAGGLVRSLGEVFQPGAPAAFGRFFADFVRPRDAFAFEAAEMTACLDAFLARLAAQVAPARLHFDLMYNTLGALAPIWTLPDAGPAANFLLNWLQARGAGVIHLLRPDLAECHASHVIAETRGLYHSGSDDDAARGMRLRLDPAAATARIRGVLRARAFVRAAFAGYARFVEIAYPDFVAGRTVAPEAAARIARLAGMASPQGLFGPSPLRVTAPDKAALVENLDEIRAIAARLEAEEGGLSPPR